MVQVSGGILGQDWGIWLIDELVGDVCHRFRGAVKQVWRVNLSYGKNVVYAEEDFRV